MRTIPNDVNSYIAGRLNELLPEVARVALAACVKVASERSWRMYLEGGYVRDALLGVPDYDVDVSVVGDGAALSERVGQKLGLKVTAHGQFGTATLELGEGLHLDVVTARREKYPFPGALPVVEAATIEEDLGRRDFTVNAMAVEVKIGPDGRLAFAPLLDLHGGVDDLRAGLIRVLHQASFQDDPTRIFRAVKLAERLWFKVEQSTLELILRAVRDGALGTVSIDRIVRELLLIMEEPRADAMLAMLEKLGVLAASHPGLGWTYQPGTIKPTEPPELGKEQRRDSYLVILGAEYAADPNEAEALARSLRLNAEQIRLMRAAARLAQLWPSLGEEGLRPSQIYNILRDLDVKALEAWGRIGALAKDTVPWDRLHDYLSSLRHVKTLLRGDYLREAGVPPGPAYKTALDALLEARLDGVVDSREDEERFVKEWLKRESSTQHSEIQDEGRDTQHSELP